MSGDSLSAHITRIVLRCMSGASHVGRALLFWLCLQARYGWHLQKVCYLLIYRSMYSLYIRKLFSHPFPRNKQQSRNIANPRRYSGFVSQFLNAYFSWRSFFPAHLSMFYLPAAPPQNSIVITKKRIPVYSHYMRLTGRSTGASVNG